MYVQILPFYAAYDNPVKCERDIYQKDNDTLGLKLSVTQMENKMQMVSTLVCLLCLVGPIIPILVTITLLATE